ncbi:28S ribosomal protein S28, mitochondrial [Anthophora quadrimaculata]
MNRILRYQRIITQGCFAYIPSVDSVLTRNYHMEETLNENVGKRKKNKVNKLVDSKKSFRLVGNLDGSEIASKISKLSTFPSLLRHSKFVDLGDPKEKIVIGEIFQTIGNDLYIDFGWKFHCVCPRPTKDSIKYVRGSKVKLRIKDLELSTRFLGASSDLTLLEADCTLISLVYSPLHV